MARIEDEATGKPSWRVPAVTRIVKKLLNDISRGPLSAGQSQTLMVLADALQDNGCTDGAVLAYLRGSKNITRDAHRTRRVLCLINGGKDAESVLWLDQLAQEVDHTYNRVMLAADNYADGGGSVYDRTGAFHSVDPSKWKQFWGHYAQVTGTELDAADMGNFFTDEDPNYYADSGGECSGC